VGEHGSGTVLRCGTVALIRDRTQQDIPFGGTVDIKVGIQHVNREVVVDSNDSAKDVEKAFANALSDGGFLRLTDTHGRNVLIPASKIAYIDLGEENARRVGFGTL
jgi:hypothetical protein